MLIPLRDENPTRSTPYINYALVAANALIFIYELTLSPKAQALLAATYGTVPSRFVHALSGHGNFEAAVFSIIAAGIFDGLDGRMARLLKATSSFGAELDSLSDFVSFGVAPAFTVNDTLVE